MLLLLISQQVTNSFLLSILSDFKDRCNAIRRIHSTMTDLITALGKFNPKFSEFPPDRLLFMWRMALNSRNRAPSSSVKTGISVHLQALFSREIRLDLRNKKEGLNFCTHPRQSSSTREH